MSKEELKEAILPKETLIEMELKCWYAYNLKNYQQQFHDYLSSSSKRYAEVFKEMCKDLLVGDKNYLESLTNFIEEFRKFFFLNLVAFIVWIIFEVWRFFFFHRVAVKFWIFVGCRKFFFNWIWKFVVFRKFYFLNRIVVYIRFLFLILLFLVLILNVFF